MAYTIFIYSLILYVSLLHIYRLAKALIEKDYSRFKAQLFSFGIAAVIAVCLVYFNPNH